MAPHNILRRGALDILPHLPLDVLCEIICLLHPADLLVLARTSRTFRSFLLKSSTTFIWKAARRNVDGLPEPPPDMDEVQYAALVFGHGCHYEGCDKKARDTVWHLRIRTCAGCRPKHQPINVNESDDFLTICAILDCCPSTLEQYIPRGPFLNAKGTVARGFQESHIRSFKDDLRALPSSERQAYLDRRRQATELTTQFAIAGVDWQLSMKHVRITQLRNKRAARGQIIHDSLVPAGFGEEIDHFGWDRIRKHPFISTTRPLTDKAHSTIVEELEEYMLAWRELRMEEQVYTSRRQIFVDAWFEFTTAAFDNAPGDSPYLPLPPSATVGFSESIDSIIRQYGPTSRDSLREQLHAAFPLACEYLLDWHRTIRRELASLLPDYRAEDDDDAIHARLKLATSIFQCSAAPGCRTESRPLAYPEILFHSCFTQMRQTKRSFPRDPRSIAHQKACLAMGGGPWNCEGRVLVHPKRHLMENVLSYCGKDPKTTTAAEMDKQGTRLACVECAARHNVRLSMSWRRTVQHAITFHLGSTRNQLWTGACSTAHGRVHMLEFQSLRLLSSMLGDTLSDYALCLMCPPHIPPWNTRFGSKCLIGHIKNKHGVSSPVFGKDYVFEQNITPVFLNPLLLRC